jgi:hydroxyacylglutathione hydrolase
MKILMNMGGIAGTNCFVVADEKAKQAVMFDAPNDTTGPLLDEVQRQKWDLVGLWLTHGHFDHVADHKEVTDRFGGAKVAIHRLDEPKLEQPSGMVFVLPFVIPARSADVRLEEGQKLKVGGMEFDVMHTPGHSVGHVVYYCAAEKILVGGDLIIGGSIGRTDLPDSNHPDIEASIRRVMRLPGDTRLLPGHGQVGTLGDERQMNPYVREMLEQE